MRDYIITVNSTVDMPKEWLAERGVPVIPLKYTMEGKTYTDIINEYHEELNAQDEYHCIYECALENMRSYSVLKTIYYAITKKKQPVTLKPCTDCLSTT